MIAIFFMHIDMIEHLCVQSWANTPTNSTAKKIKLLASND